MLICLNLISDLYEFVQECSKYTENIVAKQNGQVINCKSILGLFSLDLSKNIEVEIDAFNPHVSKQFYNYTTKFAVK